MSHLKIYTSEVTTPIINARAGETKIGQSIQYLELGEASWPASLAKHPAKYVLLGIPEDIGVRANGGRPGAAGQWMAFLKAFLNLQVNLYLSGEDILLLGHVEVADLMEQSRTLTAKLDDLRALTAQVDERATPIIKAIAEAGKIPIVIGGGHNNAYACIRGVSEAVGHPINCLNVDAHTDLRPPEGRHSGNGFTYAMQEDFLENYYIYGIHESYTPNDIYEFILANYAQIGFTRFEAILKNDPYFKEALEEAVEFLKSSEVVGLEIDLDVMAYMPSSALQPDGFLVREVRQLIRQVADAIRFSYLHVCEGIPGVEGSDSERLVGKACACLVADFIKMYQE
ncbi:MAG: formimidoylglutamase [Saprospiraceae bacterium]|nr:formimidoylglutamase [Saprospiraceae bacterium]